MQVSYIRHLHYFVTHGEEVVNASKIDFTGHCPFDII